MNNPSKWLIVDSLLQRYQGYTAKALLEEDPETIELLLYCAQIDSNVNAPTKAR